MLVICFHKLHARLFWYYWTVGHEVEETLPAGNITDELWSQSLHKNLVGLRSNVSGVPYLDETENAKRDLQRPLRVRD